MELIRGTTPTIIVTVETEIDLDEVSAVWIYISQQGKVKVDKELSDVQFDAVSRTMTVTLSQNDTLALKADTEALFQIRLLMNNGTALATLASKVAVKEIYKNGVIFRGNDNG